MIKNKYLSGSVKKAFSIVECVGKSPRPLRASEVASMTSLERATAFRILTFLTSLGYIFKNTSTNLYSLGHKIFEFGDKSDFLKTLTTYSIKYLQNLSRETQLITYLAVLEGPHIVYCDKVEPGEVSAPRSFRMRQDAHSTAIGKALLAYKSYDELKEVYKSYSLHSHTTNTITTLNKLYVELRKARRNGYSINMAETFDYVYGIGAPILDSQNRAIAAISLSGTKSTINIKNIPMLASKVSLTSRQISKELSVL